MPVTVMFTKLREHDQYSFGRKYAVIDFAHQVQGDRRALIAYQNFFIRNGALYNNMAVSTQPLKLISKGFD